MYKEDYSFSLGRKDSGVEPLSGCQRRGLPTQEGQLCNETLKNEQSVRGHWHEVGTYKFSICI